MTVPGGAGGAQQYPDGALFCRQSRIIKIMRNEPNPNWPFIEHSCKIEYELSGKPKITVELHKDGAIFKIEGYEEAELEGALAKVISFAKRNEKKLKMFGASGESVTMTISEVSKTSKSTKEEVLPNYSFPDWFYEREISIADAIATLLYDLDRPLTTGQIKKVITKAWKPIDVRNVSKLLTTRGKYLFPYVYRDEETGGVGLTTAGRKWYENELLSKFK